MRQMQMEIGKQVQFFQEQVRPVSWFFVKFCFHVMRQIYEGKIKDDQSGAMSTYFYDQPSTNQRRNRYIYPTAAGSLKIVNIVEMFARTGFEAFVYGGKGFVYPGE
jgi:hypothetical protein